MADVRILHNPRCSTCRGVCELLDASDVDVEVVRYLDTPPDAAELRGIIAMLDEPADALVRRDAHFRELGIAVDSLDDEETVLALLVEQPRLLQRPVVIRDGRAIIARPPERVAELIGGLSSPESGH
ncbi:MAG: ArsC/Spx/MgsR family protein [Miltoncostaeaceae bacterium]